MPSISYAITAHNEHVELKKLLDQINKIIDNEDEVVVQLDSTATPEVLKVAEKYNVGTKYGYHRIIFNLNNDFAAFKNNLKNHCTKMYIFFIDADELLSLGLANDLKDILRSNEHIDCFSLTRINTVNGLTDEHIKKWGWKVNDEGWINYPDLQTRICLNRPEIKWEGKVHERLVGFRVNAIFPSDDGYLALIHEKDIKRQEEQNFFYSTL